MTNPNKLCATKRGNISVQPYDLAPLYTEARGTSEVPTVGFRWFWLFEFAGFV